MAEGHIPEEVMAAAAEFNNRAKREVPNGDGTAAVESIVSEVGIEDFLSSENRVLLFEQASVQIDALEQDITEQLNEIKERFDRFKEAVSEAYSYCNPASNYGSDQITHSDTAELYGKYEETFSPTALAGVDPVESLTWDPEEFKQKFKERLKEHYEKEHLSAQEAETEGYWLQDEINSFVRDRLATPLFDYAEGTTRALIKKAEELNEEAFNRSNTAATDLGEQDRTGMLYDRSSIKMLRAAASSLYETTSGEATQLRKLIENGADSLQRLPSIRERELFEPLLEAYREEEREN